MFLRLDGLVVAVCLRVDVVYIRRLFVLVI
jgi:hypothetical protein